MNDICKIVEVGPRDGLQNEKEIVPTGIKMEFIRRLIASGLQTIEVTSFVSPRWVPQMADHEKLISQLPPSEGIQFSVLVPNLKGLENAYRCGVKNIAVFAAATETFSQKNIHRSISDSLQEFKEVTRKAIQYGMRVRGYVSCVLGCPYEGVVPLSQVVRVAKALEIAGCYEISLGDTIGVGTPTAARNMIKAVTSVIPTSKLAVHFHDTYGQALANIYACLDLGIQTIDSSVAGLGGCPYAKGATGNVATEDVIYMLQGLGIETKVNLDALIEAGFFICQYLKLPNRSKVAIASLATKTKGE